MDARISNSEGSAVSLHRGHLNQARRAYIAADPDPWLDLTEASVIVGVSTATLRRQIRAGRLRHARVGGYSAIRLRKSWIDTWLEATSTPVEVVSGGRVSHSGSHKSTSGTVN